MSEITELKRAYADKILSAIEGIREGHPVGESISLEQFAEGIILLEQLHEFNQIKTADFKQLKSMIETVIKIVRKNLIDSRHTANELMETIITKSKKLGLLS